MEKKYFLISCIFTSVIMLLVVGCATFQPVASGELVGTWEGTVTPDGGGDQMQVEFEFKNNGTFSEQIVGTPIKFSGTYKVDSGMSTLNVTVTATSDEDVVPVGANFVQDIVISSDKNTFKASGGGSSGKFTRK